MPNYSPFVVEQIFESVWEKWINKSGEASAEKAVKVFLKSETKETLLHVCEAYRLEHLGDDPQYTHKLSNFLNQDIWLDIQESISLERLQEKYNQALEIVTEWNKVCNKHWIAVDDIETKIPLGTKALSNVAFKQNWRKALDKANRIFKYPFRDGDPRQKLILSFRWFTNIVPEKHTVMKIMEGEYGQHEREERHVIKTCIPVDQAARSKLAEEMKVLFPDLVKKEPTKEQKELSKPIEISQEAIVLAEMIKSKQKPYVKEATATGTIAEGIAKGFEKLIREIPADACDDDDDLSLS